MPGEKRGLDPFFTGTVILIAGMLFGGVCGYGIARDQFRSASKATAAVTAPTVEPDDSWVLRRLQACDAVCGPVPMEVHATKDSITCNCGRPERLRPLKLAKGG